VRNFLSTSVEDLVFSNQNTKRTRYAPVSATILISTAEALAVPVFGTMHINLKCMTTLRQFKTLRMSSTEMSTLFLTTYAEKSNLLNIQGSQNI
jgi:hypothetical protein